MSTAIQNVFRMIKQGKELRILFADSEEYNFGKIDVYPVHICFTDESCFPYRKETAHHEKSSNEIKLMVNQRERMGYLLDDPNFKGFKCKLQNAMKYLKKDGEDYYAFIVVK